MSDQTFWPISCSTTSTTQRFLASGSPESDTGCEVAAIVEGRFARAPTHAVFAHWIVQNDAYKAAVWDALVRRRGAAPTEYVVIGFYGDKEGQSAARSHPAMVEWAAAHPLASVSAVDTTGTKLAAVVTLERS